MRHKQSTIRFAQGWLAGQIENSVTKSAENQNEDPTNHLLSVKVQEQWAIIDEALDDLIKENMELNRKLLVVESALK